MATRPTAQAGSTSIMDCPRCGQLCMGAKILPCCHLLCRKCLALELESDKYFACPTCHSTVATGRRHGQQRLDQFPDDDVMDSLVAEDLAEQSGGVCCVPHETESRQASHVCFDCGDVLCDSCSHVHRNISSSKDHVLKSLESLSIPTSSLQRQESQDAGGVDRERNNPQDNLQTEAELFQQAIMTLDRSIKPMQDLLDQKKRVRRVLRAYADYASSADVILTDVIRQRFRFVREECLSMAEVECPSDRERRWTQRDMCFAACVGALVVVLLGVFIYRCRQT